MERLIPLGSAGGSDPSAVGAKAARLSDAKLAGLPVLPGWVLPPPAAVTAIRLDLVEPGPGEQIAASRAAEALHVDAATLRDLALVAHRSFRTSVVRSSTPVDEDGRWAGAFATYHDVDRSMLPLAVRGCWASAFSCSSLAAAASSLRTRAAQARVKAITIGMVRRICMSVT